MSARWESWNGRILHLTGRIHQPENLEELSALVAAAPGIRALGSGKSSADIVAGTEELIHMGRLKALLAFDQEQGRIEVEAGMMLSTLLGILEDSDWEIPSLPDLDDQTLGGAVAVGSHGTGREGRSLSDYLSGCRLVCADGRVLDLDQDRDGDIPFDAIRVSLGLLGIFYSLTFTLVPKKTYFISEEAVKNSQGPAILPELIAAHEYTRILYLPHTGWSWLITAKSLLADTASRDQTSPDQKTRSGPPWLKHRRATSALFYRWCTRFPGLTGMANRLLKALFFSSPSRKSGSLYGATVTKSRAGTMELMEWSIPLGNWKAFHQELETRLGRSSKAWAHIPMDIRHQAGSKAWLSISPGPSVTMGLVCRVPKAANDYLAFDLMEEVASRHGGRPHWSKRHHLEAGELSELYPRWQDFLEVRKKMDPQGKFLNGYLRGLFTPD